MFEIEFTKKCNEWFGVCADHIAVMIWVRVNDNGSYPVLEVVKSEVVRKVINVNISDEKATAKVMIFGVREGLEGGSVLSPGSCG